MAPSRVNFLYQLGRSKFQLELAFLIGHGHQRSSLVFSIGMLMKNNLEYPY
jgi:hypothetical protein